MPLLLSAWLTWMRHHSPLLVLSPAQIHEGGVTVWSKRSYVPGVAGLTGASVSADGTGVTFAAGSGHYSFTVQAPSTT